MAARRFDRPQPKPIQFSTADRQRMVEFCQHMRPHLERVSQGERYEAGLMAMGLANLARDLLDLYPVAFRRKILRVITDSIFDDKATNEAPKLISLH